MAGLGRKEFNSGDILLASEVQGYLQDQAVMVFDDATARGSAIPSPSEGMLTYNKDTDQLELYDGSAFGPVGSDSGLIHIDTQTFSAVSAVNVNNVFTTAFKNYKIIVNLSANTGGLSYRNRAAGTDATTSYHNATYAFRSGNAAAVNTANENAASCNLNASSTGKKVFEIDVFSPQENSDTQLRWTGGEYLGAGFQAVALWGAGQHETAFQADGFTFTMTSSTGTIQTFGYKD